MAPVLVFKLSPLGRLPDWMEYVYGGTPPLAVKAELYDIPTWPVVVGQDRVIGGGVVMTMVQVLLAVLVWLLEESVTWAVKENVPAWVGVPVMAPVEVFNVRPGGRVPVVIAKV